MTLVSDIIQRAYRVSNLIPLSATPSAAQTVEALALFNPIVISSVGNEAGDDLTDINIGGTYDLSSVTIPWVPQDSRLLLQLTAARTFMLHPNPQEGQRIAVVDINNNLGTYNVILNGNGRNIETASTLTLSTNGTVRQWMYRGDTGNWVRITSLLSSDDMPFPTEFDDYFIMMLAMRLNPSYGQSMTPESVKMLSRSRNLLQSRYNQLKQIDPDVDWRSVPSQRRYYASYNADDFATGRVYPWR